jgi:hypothetical protein
MKNHVPFGLAKPARRAAIAAAALLCVLGAGCESESLHFPPTGSGDATETGAGGQGAGTSETGAGGEGAGTPETGAGGEGAGTSETGAGGEGAGTSETGAGGQGGSGGPGGGGQGGSGGMGGPGGPANGGGNPNGVGECIPSCYTPADCTTPESPAVFDASHYSCVAGVCDYLGCKNDDDCTSTYGSGVKCLPMPGTDHNECIAPCMTAVDCGVPGGPALLDPSHYLCTGGVCEHLGCQTDDECHPVKGPNTVCAAVPGSPYKDCLRSCTSAADCAQPGVPAIMDADNYTCVAGACQYKGCLNNGECATAYGQSWICQ